jgi:hypothetical protein
MDLNSTKRFAGKHDPDSELGSRSEIAPVERDDRLRSPVHRRFEDKLVVRVPQLRPPKEVKLNWLRDARKRVQQVEHIDFRRAGCVQMFRSHYDSLILQKQWDADEQRRMPI